IGLRQPFLHQVCLQVSNEMGDVYPELTTSADFMVRMVRQEEERFSETLDKGLEILAQELESLEAAGRRTVPGDLAFKLYDTYGFPLDIVNDVAEKQGFAVDEEAYNERMATQKQRSREAWAGSGEIDQGSRFAPLLSTGVSSTFVGYDALSATSDIVAMLDAGGESIQECGADNEAFVVTAKTPFYGESGGQVGDRGRLVTPSGAARVTETLKPSGGLTVHRVTVTQGAVAVGEQAELTVDEGLRVATARNHTCTHLLHAALRRVLGDHVNQAGSLVGPDRLRFDFTHITGLSHEERQDVEDEVNRSILADIELTSRSMPMEQAVAEGAVALFGEKYAEEVRVVSVPGVSKELCGGTHLRATGQAGCFCILTESAVAAGVRRIEAATGWQALEFFRGQRQELARIAALLKAQPGELSERVSELQTQLRQLVKENQALENRLSSSHGRDLLQEAEKIEGVTVLAARVGAPNVKALRDLMDGLRSRLESGVILLAGQQEDKVMLILSVSKDLHDHFTAPSLIKGVAAEVGGSGGGRPDLAQAGGSDPSGVDKALKRLKELVAEALQR
ncbi:MAG: alanine--tRNA ligase, partial [Desulfohalobiaceae bacterium]